MIADATPTLTADSDIELVFPADKQNSYKHISDVKDEVESILSEEAGCQVKVVLTLNTSGKSIQSGYVNAAEFFGNAGMEVVEEDF